MNNTKIPYSRIAEALDISVATVSRALKQPNLVKPETLRKIYAVIKELGGTVPETRALDAGGSRRILAITPILTNPFYTDVLQGIRNAAKHNGCTLLILNETLNKSNIGSVLKLIAQTDISGVVLLQRVDDAILGQLSDRIAVVQCSEFNESGSVPCVTIDNLDATKKLMRYLISTGKKRIVLVNCDPDRYTYARLRLHGYREALSAAGIEQDPSMIITIPDGSFSATVSAVSAMLKSSEPPEAIFCVSDIMAAAALRACALEKLRVPEDIIVAGFDNTDISVMTTPNITTVSQPRFTIASMAITQLLSVIANPSQQPQRYLVDTELILRESTGV